MSARLRQPRMTARPHRPRGHHTRRDGPHLLDLLGELRCLSQHRHNLGIRQRTDGVRQISASAQPSAQRGQQLRDIGENDHGSYSHEPPTFEHCHEN